MNYHHYMSRRAAARWLLLASLAAIPLQRLFPRETGEAMARGGSAEKVGLRVASWNAKHMGRASQDLAAAAELFVSVDILAIQEVNTGRSGAEAVSRLASEISARSGGGRYCVGLSPVPSDSRERYAFLWREDRVSYVTTAGKVIDSCPREAVTTRLLDGVASEIVREPSTAVFMAKATKGKITLSTIHLLPTAKHPEKEVEPLFRAASAEPGKWCRVVLGDFNLASNHPAFAVATVGGWRAAFDGDVKTSLKKKRDGYSMAYDNVWTRDCGEVTGQAVGNPSLFQKPQAWVYDKISDHMPVSVEIAP